MKPIKGSPLVKGKRKLNTVFVDSTPIKQTEPVAKRRTRSTSNADNVYSQRSTRRTQNTSFFELPNNYGSRKQPQESDGLSPATPSPPAKKLRRSSARLAGSSPTKCGKENVTQLLDSVDETVQPNGITVQTDTREIDTNFIANNKLTPPSPSKVANGHHTHRNNANDVPLEVLKIAHEQPYSNSDKLSLGNQAGSEVKVSSNGTPHVCSAITSFKSINDVKKDLQRKRHYSEDTTSPCRIRRLSEKGEMASMMKFFFNNKKNVHVSSARNKTTTHTSRKNAVCPNASRNGPNNKAVHPNSAFEKTVLKEIKDDMCISFACSQPSPVKSCEDSPTFNTKKTEHLDHALLASGENNDNKDKKDSSSKTDQSKLVELSFSPKPTHCDVKVTNEVNKVAHETPDGANHDQDESSSCLQRRSLRSSGIKCQPNFYALGLDLMIHRTKKSKVQAADEEPSGDLQVLSDSEVMYSKKRKLESFFEPTTSPSEAPQATTTPPSAQAADQPTLEAPKQLSPLKEIPSSGSPNRVTAESKSKKTSSSPESLQKKGKAKSRSRKKVEDFTDFAESLKPSRPEITQVELPGDPEPPPLFDEEPPSGPEVYYFESDHVALKHNKDYHSVLRAASALEAQRKQALSELDVLGTRLKEALADPIAFVDRLQRKECVALPSAKPVPPVPSIDWSKYTSPFGTFENVFKTSCSQPPPKPLTRRKNISLVPNGSSNTKQPPDPNQPVPSNDAPNKIFGKVRSGTFKQTWSVEEQRKLEELLIKYPQEPIEFNRFRKIASELGGRTPLQVQSRVQKYFLKLAKAGMVVPGRMPRVDRTLSSRSRSGNHRHRSHHQASLTRISTFFSDFHIPVKMGDDDDPDTCSPSGQDESEGGWGTMECEQISDEEEIPDELRFSDEYLEILRLKRLRKQRLCIFDKNGQRSIARHYGFQCDKCECEPIEGVRHHCIDCPQDESVDFCQSCIRSFDKFETAVHKGNHRTEPVYASAGSEKNDEDIIPPICRPYADADYTKIASATPCGEYNYLDPNFCPPSI